MLAAGKYYLELVSRYGPHWIAEAEAIAAAAGLGTNRLDEIDVLGAEIEDVVTKFRPCVI